MAENPFRFMKMSLEQMAESIKPKPEQFLTKEQLEDLKKRTHDAQEPVKVWYGDPKIEEITDDEKEPEPEYKD